MSVDIFGRQLTAGGKIRSVQGSRGPPGIGFKTTVDNQYDIDNKRLCNVADSQQPNDATNLKTVREVIKKALDAHQSVTQKSFEAHEKEENVNQQRAVNRAIHDSLAYTAEFLNTLDVRLAILEHANLAGRKKDSTQSKEELKIIEDRMKLRIRNTHLINQLRAML